MLDTPKSVRVWRAILLASSAATMIILAVALTACGGGGGRPGNNVEIISSAGAGGCAAEPGSGGCNAQGQQTCPPNNSGTWPNCTPIPPPVCAVGGDPDNNGCTCPAGTSIVPNADGAPICEPPPAIVYCAVGGDPDNNGCTCPQGTSATGSPPLCLVPPVGCSSDTYGTPPNCQPIPSCFGGYWGGNSCECPAADSGTYPNCAPPVVTPTCPAVPGAYWGGNSCECPASYIGAYPNCILPSAISLTVQATANPNTVADNGGLSGQGCAPQSSCTSISFSVTSNYALDTFRCVDSNGNAIYPGIPVSIGPFAQSQDGTQTYTVTCVDSEGLSASGTASFDVQPAAVVVPPVPDTFSCVAYTDPSTNNTEALCTYSSATSGDACYIYEVSPNQAGPYGGSQSGTNVVLPLPPSGATYQLECTASAGANVVLP